jgi:hypothetical protein
MVWYDGAREDAWYQHPLTGERFYTDEAHRQRVEERERRMASPASVPPVERQPFRRAVPRADADGTDDTRLQVPERSERPASEDERDDASGGKTHSLDKNGFLEGSDAADVTSISEETWKRVLGLLPKVAFRKALNAIISKHLENPKGWFGRKDLEQEIAIHLADKIDQYTGRANPRPASGATERRGARHEGRAQILSFVRPMVDRKVRDLVEREYDRRPSTVQYREEPVEIDGFIEVATDPGVTYDLDTAIDAARHLRLRLRRSGGKEWLAHRVYGYPLNPTERQRLRRFERALGPGEDEVLQRMAVAWLLAA